LSRGSTPKPVTEHKLSAFGPYAIALPLWGRCHEVTEGASLRKADEAAPGMRWNDCNVL
jgi:hypothetical protein